MAYLFLCDLKILLLKVALPGDRFKPNDHQVFTG